MLKPGFSIPKTNSCGFVLFADIPLHHSPPVTGRRIGAAAMSSSVRANSR